MTFEIILLLVLIGAGCAPLARRLDLPLPVLLVIAGIGIGGWAGTDLLHLDPTLVFLIFVPPLLYWSAVNTSLRDLRRDHGIIGGLAVGAVLVTVLAVAVTAHACLHGLPWAACFVLGAIVSPPDAAVTIAIARRLGIPRRLVTILEGETLFNDAAAFTAYNMAVAAAVTGSFSVWMVLPELLFAGLGGVAIGYVVARSIMILRRPIKDPVVGNSISLLSAFAAYLPADALYIPHFENFHTSGVLAVVTTGLVLSRQGPRMVPAGMRLQAQQMWQMLLFVLNTLIFLLIGIQLGGLARDLVIARDATLLLPIALVSATVILVRILWVLGATALPRLLVPSMRDRPVLPRPVITFIAWTGIRGGDTLVTALALPLTTSIGGEFPGRHAITVVAFGVVAVTLVIQGSTLRPLVRTCTLPTDESETTEELLARREIARAGMERLERIVDREHLPRNLLEQIRTHHQLRRHVRSGSEYQPENVGSSILAGSLLRINREVLAAERSAVVALRDAEAIGDDILRRIQRELDLEEVVMERQKEE